MLCSAAKMTLATPLRRGFLVTGSCLLVLLKKGVLLTAVKFRVVSFRVFSAKGR